MKILTSKINRTTITILLLLIGSLGFYFLLVRLGYIPPWHYLLSAKENLTRKDLFHAPVPGKQQLNYDRVIADIIPSATLDRAKTSILIEKSKYRLTLYHDRQPIKSYPIVLGGDPVGDKLKEGDNKTPEGIFKLRDLYPHSDWSKFLWIDYPTEDSWKKHLQAKREGRITWSESIGGEVGIHGVPEGQDSLINNRTNWTLGCISLKNKDVDELYHYVRIGTLVEIIP
jgi:murein L,D-transpeptidase YafK